MRQALRSPLSMSAARLVSCAAAPERLRWRSGEASLATALVEVEAALSRCDAREWSRSTVFWTGPTRRVVWAASAIDLAESVELLVNAALAHDSASLLECAMSLHGPRQQSYWRTPQPRRLVPEVRRVVPSDIATAFGAFAGDEECLDEYPWLQHQRRFVGTTRLSWGPAPYAWQRARVGTSPETFPDYIDPLGTVSQTSLDPLVSLSGLRALRQAGRLLRDRAADRQAYVLLLARAAGRVRNSGNARAAILLRDLLEAPGWAGATARRWALEGVGPNGWYDSLLCGALTPTSPVQVTTPDDTSSWHFWFLQAGGTMPFAWAPNESAVGRRLECVAVRGPFECLPTAVSLSGRVLLILHGISERSDSEP